MVQRIIHLFDQLHGILDLPTVTGRLENLDALHFIQKFRVLLVVRDDIVTGLGPPIDLNGPGCSRHLPSP